MCGNCSPARRKNNIPWILTHLCFSPLILPPPADSHITPVWTFFPSCLCVQALLQQCHVQVICPLYSGLRAHSAAQTGNYANERLIHLGAVTEGALYISLSSHGLRTTAVRSGTYG